MEFFADAARYALPFLAVLTVLVFVHELGHYLVARWCGVRVDVFSVGFGRELIGRTDKNGTRWKISWIPFGGYVKFFGDAGVASQPDLAAGMSEAERQECFHFKPLGPRAAVVAAGPIANFLFAIVVFAGMYVFIGQPYTPAIVGFVEPDSAADRAGFQIGDHITEINGESIERFEEIQAIVRLSLDRHLTVQADRGGAQVELLVSPKIVVQKDRFGNETRIGRLGIGVRGRAFIQHDPLSAIWQATRQTLFVTTATLDALGQMIVGSRSADELRGPLGIAQLSGQVASVGLESVIQFMAFLSISLGLINLFPIPMLDGGHLLFYGIEAVRGRPLGERSQEYGFRIGLALVVTLMLFATWNDLVQLRVVAFMVDLFS